MSLSLEFLNNPKPVRIVKNGILRLWWMLRRLLRFIVGRRGIWMDDANEITVHLIVPEVVDHVFRSNQLFLHLRDKK